MDFVQSLKYALKAWSNVHRQGERKNVFLFATPRGGSTWVMEIIASQPGMKYYDEPLNIRRDNVRRTGLFPSWESVSAGTADHDRIVDYLERLSRNEIRFMNPPPFRRNHRLLTNRVVFKIHECEHMIEEIRSRCDGVVLYLVRHPVSTTISRAVFPRLDFFLESPWYRDHLDPAAVPEIARIGRQGSRLERGVVSWCFENLVPLRFEDRSAWLTVTYEELVLNPRRSCDLLIRSLDLPDREAALRAFGQPAANIAMSADDTHSILREADERERRRKLVTKFRKKVDSDQERAAMRVLPLFGLDAYRAGRFVADPGYLHFADTEALLENEGVSSPVS